jgi:hypothetical protein
MQPIIFMYNLRLHTGTLKFKRTNVKGTIIHVNTRAFQTFYPIQLLYLIILNLIDIAVCISSNYLHGGYWLNHVNSSTSLHRIFISSNFYEQFHVYFFYYIFFFFRFSKLFLLNRTSHIFFC